MKIDLVIFENPKTGKGQAFAIKFFDLEKLAQEIFDHTGTKPGFLYNTKKFESDRFFLVVGNSAKYIYSELQEVSDRAVLLNLSRDLFEDNGIVKKFAGIVPYLLRDNFTQPTMLGHIEYVEFMEVKILEKIVFPEGYEFVKFRKESKTTLGALIVDYLKAIQNSLPDKI